MLHWVWTFLFGLNLFFISGFSARWLFSWGHFHERNSFFPSALEQITGYALTGLLCLFSLFLFGTMKYGGVLACLASYSAFYCFYNRPSGLGYSFRFSFSLVIKVIFLAVIFMVYLPCLFGWSTKFHLPAVYDLPKHIAAVIASSHATRWPVPNPYFPDLDFAYNLLFYLPLGFIVRCLNNSKFFLPVFAFALLWVSWQTLGILETMMKKFAFSRWQQCAGLLFATFVSNLIVLLFATDMPMGFFLHQHNLANVWVDSPLISFLYLPQHLFSCLCIFSAWLLFNSPLGRIRPFLYLILLVAAVLTSYILAPLAVFIFLGFIVLEIVRASPLKDKFNVLMALILFIALAGYFIYEAKTWSESSAPLFGWPIHMGWGYILFSEAPLLLGCLFSYSFFKEQTSFSLKLSYGFLCLAALFFLLISHDTDMKIKIALFLRLLLIFPAIAGYTWCWQKLDSFRLKTICFLLPLAYFSALSIITFGFVCTESFILRDINEVVLLKKMQRLPFNDKILFLNPNMEKAAVSGHLVFMDFRPYREDAYLPARQRAEASHFFAVSFPPLQKKGIKAIFSQNVLISDFIFYNEKLPSLTKKTWKLWINAPVLHLSASNPHTRYLDSSEQLIDAAFYTFLKLSPGYYQVTAEIQGHISEGNAHLSLMGFKKLITIPPGKYSATKLVNTFFIDKPGFIGNIAFGLGGWELGRGKIQLTGLEIISIGLLDEKNKQLKVKL